MKNKSKIEKVLAKKTTNEEFYENLLDNEDIYFSNDRI